MSKETASKFSIILMILMLITPIVWVAVDQSMEYTFLLSDAEEESQGAEKEYDIELWFPNFKSRNTPYFKGLSKNRLEYFFKKYSQPHSAIISPPPDLFKG